MRISDASLDTAVPDMSQDESAQRVVGVERASNARYHAARRAQQRRKWLIRASQLGVAVVIIGGWQLMVNAGKLDPFFFSKPSLIADRIVSWIQDGTIWDDLAVTLWEGFVGLVIGLTSGLVVGLALARFTFLAAVFDPYVNLGNAVPRILLAPIFLLWFGLGQASKVALVVSLVFFLVFFNAYRGASEVDRTVLNNARMLGASERQILVHVTLPSSLVWILSSLRASIGFAITGAVAGEYFGSSAGIGYLIAQYKGVFDTTGVMAGMTILVIFVGVIDRSVTFAEAKLLKWSPNVQK